MFIFIKKKNEIMENKKFIQIMKKIVREEMRSVIKQELTEILQEGLSSTISQLQEKQNNNVIKRKNTIYKRAFTETGASAGDAEGDILYIGSGSTAAGKIYYLNAFFAKNIYLMSLFLLFL